jgi:serine/threonine protein kinase
MGCLNAVMLVELMAGSSLADNLSARSPGFNLGAALWRRWSLDLLRALQHLHDRDPILMHRDVKPENLLLTAGNPVTLKLSDFGFAKMVICRRSANPLSFAAYTFPLSLSLPLPT